MVFGKIEYLNLLPFHIFMKRFLKHPSEQIAMHYYGGVPSAVNQLFLKRKVDAGFISSIVSKKFSHINLGIIAKKEVLSVLVLPDTDTKNDSESATSNVLAKILGVKGEVVIGDKALKYYLQNIQHIDLAKLWNEKYSLPFVFAVLCYHKDKKKYKKIEKEFLKTKIKIPQYLLQKAQQKTGISKKEILHYLDFISYKLDKKSQKSLKLFLKKASF